MPSKNLTIFTIWKVAHIYVENYVISQAFQYAKTIRIFHDLCITGKVKSAGMLE